MTDRVKIYINKPFTPPVFRRTCQREWRERPLRRPSCKWEDNIKMDFMEIGMDGANWIRLAQDRVQWRASVSTVINIRFP
jgi:hypothetical protein